MSVSFNGNPFHSGELHVQKLAGTSGVASELGQFLGQTLDPVSNIATWFSNLNIAWLASITPCDAAQTIFDKSPDDHRPRIWVSAVFGPHGFIFPRDPENLIITLPPSVHTRQDILYSNISVGNAPVAFLAIDFEARRRYRANGTVQLSEPSDANITIHIAEAFPNCPKYIQKRIISTNSLVNHRNDPGEATFSMHLSLTLSLHDVQLIKNADTFFLGTYNAGTGVDINHRGGQPGFVRVLNDSRIMWPDYRGNGMFQSFGNLHVNNRAGITFLDFDTGLLLQLTGRARIEWEKFSEENLEAAALRVVYFDIDAVRRSEGPVTPYRWQLLQPSMYNPEIPDSSQAGKSSEFPVVVTLVKTTQESVDVKTFRFLAPKFVKFLPGQYATFEFSKLDGIGDDQLPAVRTWTLSEAANSSRGDVTLEISVKRKAKGLISSWLHEHAAPGMKVLLRGIGGEMSPFGEDHSIPSKLLMLSAGIGITPNMAIVRGLGTRFGIDAVDGMPDVVMLHQERCFESMPFRSELLRRCKASNGKLRMNVHVSGGLSESDKLSDYGRSGVLTGGRITVDCVRQAVDDLKERVVYLCGPTGFMDELTKALVVEGVDGKDIVFEKFDF